jgi:hypothetical protein
LQWHSGHTRLSVLYFTLSRQAALDSLVNDRVWSVGAAWEDALVKAILSFRLSN